MGFTRRGRVRTPMLDIAYEEAGPEDAANERFRGSRE